MDASSSSAYAEQNSIKDAFLKDTAQSQSLEFIST